MSTMEPLAGTMPVALVDQSMIFNSYSMWGTYTCLLGFSMDPQATQTFLLVAMPEAGYFKMFIYQEH